jgi:uncharacterized protein Veg
MRVGEKVQKKINAGRKEIIVERGNIRWKKE